MFGSLAKKMFGTSNDRQIKRYMKTVAIINAFEPEIKKLKDDDLRARVQALRHKAEGGTSLDDLLPDMFACVREAAVRTLDQRPFDVQLVGGMVLHEGRIAEMATGEGKTLTSTMPAALNALNGKGVHVVTANDYLAKRDAEWMSKVYRFLGLSTGVILENMEDLERKTAYGADITYGTNNQFGFDYLRDNLKPDLRYMVQRPFSYAIVDEVDSILIDEARTPLIISGPADDSAHYYSSVNTLIPELEKSDFEMDEKLRSVTLTDSGQEKIEGLLFRADLLHEGHLYDIQNVSLVHHVNQALKAHKLFQRDRDYIVKDGKVIIIDEFTGRMMEGRRYSEGLHQALEAKEGVPIQKENQTLASITFQNYFRMYPKLAGMTGTAMTEAEEFEQIYKLSVVAVPTNKKMVRKDNDDEIYRTAAEKFDAIIDLIQKCHKKDQPVLVGTTSIEKSEFLSDLLKKRNIRHNVLNARFHKQEAEIIAQAGRPGAVTIATNMAGRGTDIQLGGNLEMMVFESVKDSADPAEIRNAAKKVKPQLEDARKKVLAAGGLYIIGTERHESRRIDNQLRGRAGRQGDVGASKFFLSLEDDLMRIFGSERLDAVLQRIGMPKGEVIKHPWISKALEKAQKKVEQMHFESRKDLLKYDDVINDQRKVIYAQRREIMEQASVSDLIVEMRHNSMGRLVKEFIPEQSYPEQWNTASFKEEIRRRLGMRVPVDVWAREEGVADHEIRERLIKVVDEAMTAKKAAVGESTFRQAEQQLLLFTLDQVWKEHLYTLDHVRQGIRLRAYGQRDPLNEFKAEAFTHFQRMLDRLEDTITQNLSILHIADHRTEELVPYRKSMPENIQLTHATPADLVAATGGKEKQKALTVESRKSSVKADPSDPSTWGRVARNSTCPCGSGKKYKHCHGLLTDAKEAS